MYRLLSTVSVVVIATGLTVAEEHPIMPQGPLAGIHFGMSISEVNQLLHGSLLAEKEAQIKLHLIATFGMPLLSEVGDMRYASELNYYGDKGDATFLFFKDKLTAVQLDSYILDRSNPIDKAARIDLGQRFHLLKQDGADAKYAFGPTEVYLMHLPVSAGIYVRLLWRDHPSVQEMAEFSHRRHPQWEIRKLMEVDGWNHEI